MLAQTQDAAHMADSLSPSSSDVEAHSPSHGDVEKHGTVQDSEVVVDGAETYLREDIAIDHRLERKIM